MQMVAPMIPKICVQGIVLCTSSYAVTQYNISNVGVLVDHARAGVWLGEDLVAQRRILNSEGQNTPEVYFSGLEGVREELNQPGCLIRNLFDWVWSLH